MIILSELGLEFHDFEILKFSHNSQFDLSPTLKSRASKFSFSRPKSTRVI